MKRFIVILLVLILVGGGGAGGLIMMGVVPNPFNPDAQGLLSDAEKAAAEQKNKFQPPSAALQLVKVNDMIIPVINDGRLVRRVFITARLVVAQAQHKTLVEDNLPHYQDTLVRELIPFFQTHFNHRNVVDVVAVKKKLMGESKRIYGDLVQDVLLVNVFQQESNR